MTAPAVTISLVVASLERAWAAIRAKHPDVPECALIVASGAERGQMKRWGHYWHGRWEALNAGRRPEVMISGEGLNRPAADVLETLIHEAAHGVAATRKIEDTSRQGRWHNGKYKKLAVELGLQTQRDTSCGLTTSLADGTLAQYAPTLADLTDALKLYRVPEQRMPRRVRPDRPDTAGDEDTGTDTSADTDADDNTDEEGDEVDTSNGLVGICTCGRKLRGSVSVWKAGAVTCGVCNAPFQVRR